VSNSRLLDLAHDVIESEELPLDGNALQIVTLAPWQLWMARHDEEYSRMVAAADATTIDGRWLGLILRLARRPHAIVTGRGIVERYLSEPSWMDRVAVVGSSDEALVHLSQKRPDWYATGGNFGRSVDEVRLAEIVAEIRAREIQIVFIALGSPKQETWGRRIADEGSVCVIGVGGAVETALGFKRRPPLIVQRLKMEWLYRTAQDPRRFVPRVMQALSIIPPALIEALQLRMRESPQKITEGSS